MWVDCLTDFQASFILKIHEFEKTLPDYCEKSKRPRLFDDPTGPPAPLMFNPSSCANRAGYVNTFFIKDSISFC